MIIEKLNTSLYAIKKHLHGYELLKNPKGTSPDEVNMIKTSYRITELYCDDCYTYTRLQRKKVNGKVIEIKKHLDVTRFMDTENKSISAKKRSHYFVLTDGRYVTGSEKSALTELEQNSRQKLNWKNFEEYNDYIIKKFLNERVKSFFQPTITLFDRILTFGHPKFFRMLSGIPPEKPVKPSFIKILLANLK